MQIRISSIVSEHFRTIKNPHDSAWLTIILVFGMPLTLGASAFLFSINPDRGLYSLSITFFGIFIALVLNVQVAIFGIFQRRWAEPSDEITREAQNEILKSRQALLRRLNINASYLEIFACLSLTFFLTLFVFDLKGIFVAFISIFLYSHFIISLFELIKRTYVLFLGEYDLPEIQ